MVERIRALIELLNEANKAYYYGPEEIMSNRDYDELYDELLRLEQESGIVLSNSPTQNVGYEVVSELPKERHPSPMQSLDKTKDREQLKAWLGMQIGVMSWKEDGLTVCLTYENGNLKKAVTRGNGEVGELITQNAREFVNTPLRIPCQEKVVVRGEAVIRYSDFEKINARQEVKYKNPRNLCSGTVRQLDSRVVSERPVYFMAFELVTPSKSSYSESLGWLREQGFDTVEHRLITKDNFDEEFQWWEENAPQQNIPTDGLVLRYDDYEYGESLGRTDKFPRHSMAFKWKDETASTTLRDIEWKTTRSGTINPVAVFDPVELEGTTVERATLFNVSNIEKLQLGIGDELQIFKANLIIPQVADNFTRSGTYEIPGICPECGHRAVVKQENDSKILYCVNPACKAKLLSRFTHFVSRDCMNIDGLSEATLEKMIDNEWIQGYSDLYALHSRPTYVNEMMHLPGLGRKSVNNILDSIEKSRKVQLNNFINALGIPGIGKKQAKQLAEYFDYDFWKFDEAVATLFDFTSLAGFGDVLCDNIRTFFDNVDAEDYEWFIAQLEFVRPSSFSTGNENKTDLSGQVFVITGKLEHYKNRQALVDVIESMGGRVADSVTKKTSYLINNDIYSTSGKNKKAHELGIQIITEEDFKIMIGGSAA